MPVPLRATEDWPPRYVHRPGQGPARKFSAVTWLRSLSGMAQQFKGEVPADYWNEDVDESGARVAVIACPCGAEPVARENATSICPGDDCGRVFVLLGDRIRVAQYDPAELSAEDP